jgi:peptide deformylase
MAKILIYPDPILRQIAEPVTRFDSELAKLIEEMRRLATPDGKVKNVGLAATQIGVLKRVFLMHTPDDNIEAIINPEIIKAESAMLSSVPQEDQYLEGCLSFPGYYAFVDRPIKIKVRYQTEKGLPKERTLTYPFSSYFLHERDHLDGILFIDYIKKSGEQMYWLDKKTDKLKKVKNPFLVLLKP